MNYELAKKLKDAGFPYIPTPFRDTYVIDGEDTAVPNLSELIEACGDKFLALGRMDNKEKGLVMWVARAHPKLKKDDCGAGSPEEAVANLWLELKKSAK